MLCRAGFSNVGVREVVTENLSTIVNDFRALDRFGMIR